LKGSDLVRLRRNGRYQIGLVGYIQKSYPKIPKKLDPFGKNPFRLPKNPARVFGRSLPEFLEDHYQGFWKITTRVFGRSLPGFLEDHYQSFWENKARVFGNTLFKCSLYPDYCRNMRISYIIRWQQYYNSYATKSPLISDVMPINRLHLHFILM
jgi:hypothetical protein